MDNERLRQGMRQGTITQKGLRAASRRWKRAETRERSATEKLKKLQAEVKRLQEIIRRAPCSQDSIPCRWPCGNDPSEHGPCWKQEALAHQPERKGPKPNAYHGLPDAESQLFAESLQPPCPICNPSETEGA